MTKKSLLAKELKIRKEGINAMLTKVDGYLVDKSFNSDDILDMLGISIDDASTELFDAAMNSNLTTIIGKLRYALYEGLDGIEAIENMNLENTESNDE